MDIAFCCDQAALAGLHVTLVSLLKAQLLSDRERPLRIHIFQEGMSEKEQAGLRKTTAIYPRLELSIAPFSTAGLTNLQGLHGNYMPYGRLFLGDLLPGVERLIYLDSDLLVNCSLLPIWEADLGEHVLGAISVATVEWSLEKEFLVEQGLSLDDPYFNSGVLLLDLARFRREGWKERCLAFLESHTRHCHDQTVLNAFFSRAHLRLPAIYNLPAFPNERFPAKDLPRAILHFLGAPKPWDLGGKTFHRSGRIFANFLRETAFEESRERGGLPGLQRLQTLSKAYLRILKARLRGEGG